MSNLIWPSCHQSQKVEEDGEEGGAETEAEEGDSEPGEGAEEALEDGVVVEEAEIEAKGRAVEVMEGADTNLGVVADLDQEVGVDMVRGVMVVLGPEVVADTDLGAADTDQGAVDTDQEEAEDMDQKAVDMDQ